MGGELAINGKTIKEISEILSQVFNPKEIVMYIKIHNKPSLNINTIVSEIRLPLSIATSIFGDYKTLYTKLDTYSRGEDLFNFPCVLCGVVIKEENL